MQEGHPPQLALGTRGRAGLEKEEGGVALTRGCRIAAW